MVMVQSVPRNQEEGENLIISAVTTEVDLGTGIQLAADGTIFWFGNGTTGNLYIKTQLFGQSGDRFYVGADGNVGLQAVSPAFGAGATYNFILGGGATSPVIGAVAADVVHVAAVDFAAGDRRLYVQSELGSPTIIGNSAVRTGLAGTATGSFVMSGATSGVVTVTVGAAAGTWTMQLPAAVGAAGQQLTDAAGDGITSWAAAGSLREHKLIVGVASPEDALARILSTSAYRFHYRKGFGTRDYQTEYVGVMADEAPWAMHYGGSIVNPVNTLGYMVLGFQAMETSFPTRLRQEMLALLDADEEFRQQVREKLAAGA